jgi:hypothetical protein
VKWSRLNSRDNKAIAACNFHDAVAALTTQNPNLAAALFAKIETRGLQTYG